MPTANPRVNVTLSISLDNLVARLAAFQRVSKSQVLRELLETAEPALQRAVILMDSASKASPGALQSLAHRLERDVEAAEDAAAVVMARLDRGNADLVSQAEAIRGKRPARAGAREAQPHGRPTAPVVSKRGNPPASNRGVKSSRTGKKGATQGATKRSRS